MSPLSILFLVLGYFAILLLIARITGKNDSNETFFTGNRNSPWFVVAFGMIGASLSGVTFISVPGWVADSKFAYMQMVLGYFAGYVVIAHVLLPLYYRLNLTSIYTYLRDRFGNSTYKTGAVFFLISRIVGASFRLFLVANVLQLAVFDALGVPFAATVFGTILLIWVYTFRGGIKTIVYTDTLQTLFMLLAVGLTVYYLSDALIPEGTSLVDYISAHPDSQVWFFGEEKGGFWNSLFNGASGQHFLKQFLGGMFITICMTGLDQDMMQKNLTCRSLKDAQKNMYGFSISLIFVNLLFLSLGILLYDYAAKIGIDAANDDLYPAIALTEGLPAVVTVFFIIGLIASAYSSADSALTSLTTSFSVDILEVDTSSNDREVKALRRKVHIGMSLVIFVVIILFKYTAPKNVISDLFRVATYTYGPLLGLYAFGLMNKRPVRDQLVPIAAIASPTLAYVMYENSERWFNYTFGFELLLLNGAFMMFLLWLLSLGKIGELGRNEEVLDLE
ncbi:sodium:solute symporter [Phaeocystidibacter luteus]|uniref:Sodium:solute symporter n=1 Tax=Phaeocystidibacter luteus TaxID=911197 RepID=A0A6N6RM58_9FLAO|nr:sodium:solute symporter [Phaeocystidibacter luteus]KAB2814659.1 sodium:solute symporter [Phaeocystidibacter luteus]